MGLNIKKKSAAEKEENMVAPQGETTVDKSSTGSKVIKQHTLPMVKVPEAYANVGMTAARTINLGEYNSVKIGVSLFYPCAPNKVAIEETYSFVKEWVDGKMERLTADNEGEG